MHARISGKSYIRAWIALVGLTALSFTLSRFELGGAGPALALAIAAGKAAVVALVFMHLLEARAANQIVAVTAVVFVALVCLGMAADVALR